MTRRFHASAAVAGFLLCAATAGQAATLTPGDFDHSMEITFSGYTRSTPLTNFPALVKLDPRTAGFSYGEFASADGADLRFTDSDGVTVINYEVEEWNTNGISSVWVQVPKLEGTGADSVYAYWGNTNGLSWDGATFDPSSDISDCALWLHGGNGVQTDGVGNVTGWLDQSGSGNNFAQAVVAEQPTYQAGVLNGNPVVRFDDSNDGMTSSLNLAAPYTVIIVFDCQVDNQNNSRAIQGSNNWLIGPWANEIVHYAGGWVNAYDLKRPNQFYTCVARNTGAASSFHVDGADRTTGAGAVGAPGTLALAAEGLYAEPLGGDIAEVIVYTRALTADEHNQVGHYLSEKYGLSTRYRQPDAPAYTADGSTWEANHDGVWHLNENDMGYREDATANVREGLGWPYNGDEGADGIVAGADNFDKARNEWIRVVPYANAVGAVTVSCWAKSCTETWNNPAMLVSKRNAYILHPIEGSKQLTWYVHAGGGWRSTTFTPTFNIAQWHHYVGTFDGSTIRLYADGDQVAETAYAGSITADTGFLEIGRDDEQGRYFDGTMDEVRVSHVTRSPDWIWAMHQNVANYSSFVTRQMDSGAFAHSMKIAFPGYTRSTPLTNFPSLVKLDPRSGGFRYDQFSSPEGADLRFVDSDGTTELKYEIEDWDTNGTSYVWVQVPVLTSGGDFVTMLWGNADLVSSYDPDTFDPAADLSGCQVWLDANVGVLTSGGVVTNWADQSGNGHHATPGGGAPVRASNQVNGRPSIQFRKDAGDDYFNVTGGFFAKEIWMVWKSPATVFNAYGGMLGTVTGRESTFIVENNQPYMHNNQYPLEVDKDGRRLRSSFDMRPITEYMVVRVVVNDGNTSTARTHYIGRQDTWSCDWDAAEIIAYDRELSSDEQSRLGHHLSRKYGIATHYKLPDAPDYTVDGATWSEGYAGVWHLHDDEGDATANENHAIAINAPGDIPGKIGDGQDFDGADDYVQAADHDSLDITGSMTASAWVYWRGSWGFFSKETDDDSQFSAEIYDGASKIRWYNWGLTTGVDMRSSVIYPNSVGAWHHVALLYDQAAGKKRIYIDGLLDSEIDASGSMVANGSPFRIGLSKLSSNAWRYFNGRMDEFRLSNVARSADWIWATCQNATAPDSFAQMQLTPASYAHSLDIQFPGYTRSATLTNFPAVVRLGPGEDGFSYDGFSSPEGLDLRFTAADGVTVLNHEIEEWDTNGTSTVWVQIPELTSSTTIRAHWGNVAGLSWDAATFNPSSDITDCALWVHAGAGVLTDAGAVTNWLDQSGNGHSFAPTSVGVRPTLQAGVLNGEPVVRFDDVDDGMLGTLNLGAPFSVFIVYNCRTAGQNASRAIQGSNNWLMGPYDNWVRHYAGGWVDAQPPPVTQNAFYICSSRNSGSSTLYFVNGGQQTDATYSGTPGILKLGAEGFVEPLGGDIAEVIVYTRTLDTEEHNRVGRYLAEKYALDTAFSNPDTPAYAADGSTWSEGFLGVWHMDQAADSDSTGNEHDGHTFGTVNPVTDAVVGPGNSFVHDANYIRVPDHNAFTLADDYTVSGWVHSDDIDDGWQGFMGTYNSSGADGFIFALRANVDNQPGFWADGTWAYSGQVHPDSNWRYLVYTRSGADGRFYINGEHVATVAAIAGSNGQNLELGGGGPSWGGNRWDGMLDELRISTVARSADWVWAEYQNMSGHERFDNWQLTPSNYTHSMKLVFTGYDSGATLTNFPAMIKLSTDLEGFGYGGFASADGYDLRFTDSDGTTILRYEVEEWDTSGASVAWVRVPELAATGNDYIWAYWGNTDEVEQPVYTTDGSTWDADYAVVWHFAATNGANAHDSTANGWDGTCYNTDQTDWKDGIAANGLEFDGVDEVVGVAYKEPETDMTHEMWIKGTTDNVGMFSVNGGFQGGSNDRNIWIEGRQLQGRIWDIEVIGSSGLDLADGRWHHVVHVFGASIGGQKLYVDGVEVASGTKAASNYKDNSWFEVGWGNYQGYYAGMIDEPRLSMNRVRSPDWIRATYQNVAEYESFVNGQLTPGDFTHSLKIVFKGYDSGQTLTNFPALVKLSTDVPGFSYGGFASPAGYDLRFTDSDGVTVIPYEVEKWNNTGQSTVWVQVPELEATGSDYIWAYWGDSDATNPPSYRSNGAVWSEDYLTVWHMTESSTHPDDSTSHGQDGINNGLVTQVSGKIADCYEVDSDGDDLLIPHVRETAVSASLWYYYSSVHNGGWNTVLGKQGSSQHHLLINDGSRHVGFYNSDNGNFNDSGVTLGLNQWHHFTVVMDGTNYKLYHNGEKIQDVNTFFNNASHPLRTISTHDGNDQEAMGKLDEIRVMRGVRSEDWMRAAYQNMANPETFVGWQLTPADFNHSMQITFSGYDKAETLTNFPVLVELGPMVPAVCSSPNGGDLRFTDSDGVTLLTHEIDTWEAGGTSYAWVKVPQLTNNASIWAHFGNASDTTAPSYTSDGSAWSDGFRGVWHMAESNALDSTAYGHDGTQGGNVDGTGLIGGAQDFPTGNNWLSVPAGLSGTGNSMTLMGLVNLRGASGDYQAIMSERYAGDGNVEMALYCNQGKLAFGFFDGAWHRVIETAVFPEDEWVHVAGTYDGHTLRLYQNGEQILASGDLNRPLPVGVNGWYIGHRHDNVDSWDGFLDEMRVGHVTRSSNWVWACSLMMTDNDAFATYGDISNVGEARYWDTSTVAGLQSGDGIWNSNTQLWSDVVGGSDPLVRWSPAGVANFTANGPATVTVEGTPITAGLLFDGSGHVLSGGSLSLDASGIVANAGAVLNTPLSLDADQRWVVAGGEVLTVGSNLLGGGALTKDGAGLLSIPELGTYSAAMTISNGTVKFAGPAGVTPPVAGYIAWLDATDVNGDGSVPAEGTTLSTWVNKAAVGTVGNFAGYASGASLPTYVSSSLHFNNRPVVRFYGNNTLQSILYNTSNLPAPVTVIYVSRLTGEANYRLLSGHGNNWLLGYHGPTRDDAYFNGWVLNGTGGAGTGAYMYEAVIPGAGDSSFYRDGALLASNSFGQAGPNGLRLGGGSGGNTEHSSGEIAELLVYNWALSDVEREAVETYLQDKWQIGELPSGVALAVDQPGTLDLNGVSQTVQSFSDSGVGGGVVTNASATFAVLTVEEDVDTTFSGTIVDGSGAVGLAKDGSGVLTLTGANTFTGAAAIEGGTLRLSGGNDRLSANSAIHFPATATLELDGITQTVANVTLNDQRTGSATGGGTLLLGNSNFAVGGSIHGTAQTLDLGGLGRFGFDGPTRTFLVGGQGGGNSQETGTLYLGVTNTITASQLNIATVNTSGNNSRFNTGTVYLGASNVINASAINLGLTVNRGYLQFPASVTNGSLTLRGTSGGATRADIIVGQKNSVWPNSGDPSGTIDLTTGSGTSTLDARLDTLRIAYYTQLNQNPDTLRGTFRMEDGRLDATAIYVGQGAVGSGSGTSIGIFAVDGGTVMASDVVIGDRNSTTAVSGQFDLNSGTLQVGTVGTGAGAATRTFNWNGGTIRNYDASTDLAIGALSTFALGAVGLPFDIDTNRQATVASALSGTGGLIKNGEGELLLHGANTYSAATTVSNGYFWGTGSVANTSITVKDGARIGPATGYTLGTLAANNVTLEAGARVPCLINGTTPTLSVSGTLTTATTNWIDLVMTGPMVSGTYTLIDYTGTIAGDDFAAFKLSRVFGSRITATLVENVANTSIDLQVTVVPPQDIKWNGNDGVAWDIDATTNWLAGVTPITFIAGDTATFDDTAASFTVEAQEVVAPSNTIVNNSTSAYTIGGEAIGGDGALTKQGTSSLTLTANNTYTGPTTVEAGTVQVGDGGTSGTLGSGAVTNLATLAYNRSDTVSVGETIKGVGELAQVGSGTLSLDVTDVVEGDLRVDNGVLRLGLGDAMPVSTAIDVNSGGTFDFNGKHVSDNTRDYQFTAEGAGPAGQGAIVNSGAGVASYASVDSLTLTDNTTLGGVNRWDIGNGTAGPALDGGGYALTKVGACELSVRPETIQNVTSVTINDGYIKYEGFHRTTADTVGMIQYVSSGGSLGSYGGYTFNMPAVFNGGVLQNHGGGTATWSGAFTLNQAMTMNTTGNNGSGHTAVSGNISGSGGITKIGANYALYLDGNNSYNGATIVSNGYLVARTATALGNTPSVDVKDGGTLQFEGAGFTVANTSPVTLTGNGVGGSAGAIRQWTGNNVFNSPITLAGYTRMFAQSSVLDLGGVIDGTNVLLKTGAASIRLNGSADNTYNGTTIVENGYLFLAKTGGAKAIVGPVQMGWPNGNQPHLRTEQPDQFAPGVVMVFTNNWGSWARFSLQGHDQTLAGIRDAGGGVIQNERQGSGGAASSAVLTISNNTDYVFQGHLRDEDDGGTTYKIGLTKKGSGTQTLMNPPGQSSRVNYTGNTVVDNGVLRLVNLTTYRSAVNTINPVGTMEVSITGQWNVPATTFNGAGTLVKSGAATMIAGQAGNTYVSMAAGGLIDIQGGVLRNNNRRGYWAANQASMSISNGAALWLYADNVYVDALKGEGSVRSGYSDLDDTLFVGVAGGSGTFSGLLENGGSGPLHITKNGAGSQTLAGNSTYSGATTVNGGTLLVNGTHANGASYTVNVGGTLGGTGTINTDVSVVAGGMLSGGDGGAGTLTTRNLALAAGATNIVQLGGTAPGVNYNQVEAVGTVNLGGSTLNVTFSYTPQMDDVYFVLLNDAVDAIVGTFDGLAEGAELVVSYAGQKYPVIVTYQADAATSSLTGGNDVALQYHYDLATTFILK